MEFPAPDAGRIGNVVVTGAAGILGTELVALLASVTDVTSADLDQFDLRDSAATRTFLSNAAPDVVINCAAYTDVDGAEAEPDTAFAVNADGAGNVAAAAEAVGARFVHVSTDYVFDGTADRPYTETDTPCPLGVYGRSKLGGELAVAAACSTPLIVRTAWLYGHAGPNFVEKMLALAEAGCDLRVVDDQVGSPTNARDLAFCIAELIAVEASGVVNATNAGSCSWYGFASEALRLAGLDRVSIEPVGSSEFPRPAPRPGFSVLSLKKLARLTDHEPRDWKTALAEYVAER